MGLFSAIGGIFGGPIGAALGGVGDGLLGAKGERKKARAENAAEMDKFVRLRDAAERGGFHPLEALRSGNVVNHTTGPNLMSTLARSNAFDALESEITGEAEKERRRQEVRDEILERELENMKIAAANSIVTRPTLRSNAVATGISARGAQDPEGIPGAVTTTDAEADVTERRFNDPNRGDMGGLTERSGESEIVETVMFPVNLGLDAVYDNKVRKIADALGRTPIDVHNDIAKGGAKRMHQLWNEVINKDDVPSPTGRHPSDRMFWGAPPGQRPPINTQTRGIRRRAPWER